MPESDTLRPKDGSGLVLAHWGETDALPDWDMENWEADTLSSLSHSQAIPKQFFVVW